MSKVRFLFSVGHPRKSNDTEAAQMPWQLSRRVDNRGNTTLVYAIRSDIIASVMRF